MRQEKKSNTDMVSILLPCYNHELYVESCLRSVLAQSYANIEVIICDDCSKDSSYNIILSFEKELKERFQTVLIWKNDENIGLTKNLNNMINASSGKYIKLLATDDMLRTDSIEELVKAIKEDESSIIYSNVYLIDEETQYLDLEKGMYSTIYTSKMPSGAEMTKLLAENNFICAPGVLYQRSAFEKYSLFDESLSFEDWEFYLRVSICDNIKYVDTISAYYRISSSSMSHFERKCDKTVYERFCNDKFEIFHRYEKFCEQEGRERFYNKQFREALAVGADSVISRIINELRSRAESLSINNKVRYLLYRLRLYHLLKEIRKRGDNK